MKLLAGAGAVALEGGRRAAAGTGVDFRTTTAVNLRQRPNRQAKVLKVLGAGTVGTDYDGEIANGYRSLDFAGTVGWVYDDYLERVDGNSGDPVIIGSAQATVAVNLRPGPSTGHKVLRVVAKGAWVEITGTVQNGFRYVVHDGLAGWIYDDFLLWPHDGQPGGNMTTTAALNLREQPSLQASVLRVIPANTNVRGGDQIVNGFRQVTYDGTTGWSSNAYLE